MALPQCFQNYTFCFHSAVRVVSECFLSKLGVCLQRAIHQVNTCYEIAVELLISLDG
jgi:hypothetical protein